MARQAQNMIKYIIKRILLMLPILISVLIFTWILSHMMYISPIFIDMPAAYDRETIERYIRQYPLFQNTLIPVNPKINAPSMIRKMTEAGKKMGVGPMAAVAGAIAGELIGVTHTGVLPAH